MRDLQNKTEAYKAYNHILGQAIPLQALTGPEGSSS
jgi:hypothetical protein